MYRFTMLLALAAVSAANACPEYGVALKPGDKDYAGLVINAHASSISIKTPSKDMYVFRWKGTLADGKWCYTKYAGEKTTEACQDPKKANEEVHLHAKNGDIVAVARMYGTPGKLSGSEKKGALLAIVENGTPDPREISYQTPWLRFAYSVDFKPDTLKTNSLSELNETLRKEGVTMEDAKAKYAINHHMYAEYFDKKDNGFVDGTPKIRGSLVLDKAEIPLQPILRDIKPLENGTADLDGNHYQGKKGGNGCQTEVEKIPAR